MSVTIRKKEQLRNTPLLTFILVVSLPLVISFLGGISAGKTSELTTQQYKKLLEEAEKKHQSADAVLQRLARLTASLDSFMADFKSEIFALENELPQVMATMDNGVSLSQWEGRKNAAVGSWQEKADLLRRKTRDEIDPAFRETVEKEIGFFDSFRNMMIQRLTNSFNHQRSLQNRGHLDELQKAQEDLVVQQRELIMQQQLSDKDREIADLKRELRDMQKNTGNAPDNSGAKTKIESAVKEIREDVIPDIPSNILSSRRSIKIKSLLEGKLTTITEAARDIK